MAIEKLKREVKRDKTGEAEPVVAPHADLEAKRAHFQHALKTKKPLVVEPLHPQKSPKSRFIIGAAIAAFIVILTGTFVAGYYIYQRPEAVVLEALSKASLATSTSYQGEILPRGGTSALASFDGSFTPKASQLNIKLKTPYPGDLSSLNASVFSTPDNLYLKVDKVSQLMQKTAPPQFLGAYKSLLPATRAKIDNQWVRVNQGEMGTYASLTHVSQCTFDLLQKLTTDQPSRSELATTYTQHAFFDVSVKSSGVYHLTVNKPVLKQFMLQIVDGEFYKSLAGCAISKDIDAIVDSVGPITVDLTIDTNREITNLDINTPFLLVGKLTIKPIFNQPVSLKEPTNAVNFSDVKSEAINQYLFNSLMHL